MTNVQRAGHHTIAAVGDIMLGEHPLSLCQGVLQSWLHHKQNPLECVSSYIGNYDLVTGNLECVISATSERESFRRRVLRVPPIAAKLLSESGFNVVSVANNHAMDHGPIAFRNTCNELSKNGITVCGTPDDPVLFRIPSGSDDGPITVAIIGVSFRPNQTNYAPLYNHVATDQEFERICESANDATDYANLVMLLCHWGDEFVPLPSPKQIRYAQKLVESGADIIVGHHPHVYQGLQKIDGSAVFFSLGNFVTDMKQRYLRIGALASIEVTHNGLTNAQAIPVRIGLHHRTILSQRRSDHRFLKRVDRDLCIQERNDYARLYSFRLGRAYKRYRIDMMLDFIKNFGICPQAKVRVLQEFLGKLVDSRKEHLTNY